MNVKKIILGETQTIQIQMYIYANFYSVIYVYYRHNIITVMIMVNGNDTDNRV
jgi:hypothetical protein